jgi:prepilin-type N-terminal cleavage/methylation domain-containing protein
MNRRHAGITLIEIIVSLAVSSIVMMAAYSFFNVSVRSWDFSSSRMDASQSSTFIIDTLEKLLKENYFNCQEWYVAEKYDSVEIMNQLAPSKKKPRTSFAFRDGINLSFNAEDQIDDNSRHFGFYTDAVSREVRLADNRFPKPSVLGQNIVEMTFTYYDKNFTTIEVPTSSIAWYTSREICWVGMKVKSVVGQESSESNRLISLWR